MDKNKSGSCCITHKSEILGVILLAIATVLTLYTQSGVGILGMFIVGLVFCTHKHFGCRGCGCTNCDCCSSEMSACDTRPMVTTHTPKKAAAPRKKAKKATV
jgi:hypothetical protein